MKFADKVRMIRKANKMTQAAFAASIGISRGNLANIELGNVHPTPMFINCLSLMYGIDKKWLTDDSNEDLSALTSSVDMVAVIAQKYDLLEDKYKRFVENQINELLTLQEQDKPVD